jgi:DNA-binding transcriptional regulator YdaS (Cro superfamily)
LIEISNGTFMNQTALERAISQAGSGVALARMAGVSPMAVSYWKVRGVPAARVLRIESATGVSRHDLRPDLYPDHLPTLDQTIPVSPDSHEPDEHAGVLSSVWQASP